MNKIALSIVCITLPNAPAFCQANRAIATGVEVDMDVAVVPYIDDYSHCLDTRPPTIISAGRTILDVAEAAIRACKVERLAMMSKAEGALAAKPGWESKSKRDAEIASDFDNTDASARKLARETDAYLGRNRR